MRRQAESVRVAETNAQVSQPLDTATLYALGLSHNDVVAAVLPRTITVFWGWVLRTAIAAT